MKKRILTLAFIVTMIASLVGCGSKSGENGQVIVYNWGEYIDPETIEMFEKETGIKVVYDEFETNEIMYPKVKAGAVKYDVICPSDYMVAKMIESDLLHEINLDEMPNAKANIGKQYWEMSTQFDPGNKYSIPYCWGTVGILYNKEMISEPITSWADLWKPEYSGQILMQASVRDLLMVGLKKNGYSMNSLSEDELKVATKDLVEQKPLVQAYVIDEVRDKMIGNEAAIGIIYSGEAIYTQRENENLVYVYPEEGTNVWIDNWVITKNTENYENAVKFIDFMCRPDIAKINFDFITYSTPNEGAQALIEDEEIRNSYIAFPNLSDYKNLETYTYLGEDNDEMYNEFYKEILGADN